MNVGKITSNQINSAPVTNATTSTNTSKNIQTQISAKQQHLDRLASDSKLDAQEKEKKRREIQKEIDELNRKLELARMEQEKEDKKAAKEQQKEEDQTVQRRTRIKTKSEDEANRISNKADSDKEKAAAKKEIRASEMLEVDAEKRKQMDIAIEDVQKMLTADYQLQKELTQKHVDSQIESTVRILKSEIRQDEFLETDTSQKEAELEALKTKENFWTEEAQKRISKTQQTTQDQSHQIAAMNVQAKLNIELP